MPDPSIEGLLTPEEHEHALRLAQYVAAIRRSIDRLNVESGKLTRPDGAPLRKVEAWPVALIGNDLSIVLFAHEQAEKRLAIAAQDAVIGACREACEAVAV